MKIRIFIDKKYTRPEIVICASEENERILELKDLISRTVNGEMTCYTEYGAEVLPLSEIVSFYSEKQKVYARTETDTYTVKMRLYELEEALMDHPFLRISNSEIVNIRKIMRLDTDLTGTIRMHLKGNITTYVSRRYVPKIKKALGI